MPVVSNGNRAEDTDIWAKLALWRQRYWPLVMIALGVLVALGFDFKTPRTYYQEVNQKVEAVEARVEAVESAGKNTDTKIDVLLRFRCIDESITARERQVAGLDCDRLLNPTNNGSTP